MNIQKVNNQKNNITFKSIWTNGDRNKQDLKTLFPDTKRITYTNYKYPHDFLSDEEANEMDATIKKMGKNREILLEPKESDNLNRIKNLINKRYGEYLKSNNSSDILVNEKKFRQIAKEKNIFGTIKQFIEKAVEIPNEEIAKGIKLMKKQNKNIRTNLLKQGIVLK